MGEDPADHTRILNGRDETHAAATARAGELAWPGPDIALMCPGMCPRTPRNHPKPPHASQRRKEKPLGKSATYRGVSFSFRA